MTVTLHRTFVPLAVGAFAFGFLSFYAFSAEALTINCVVGASSLPAPCTDSSVFATTGASDLESGPSSASVAGASASASFNSDHAVATVSISQANSEFFDTFDITGGSGTGTAIFEWSLTGTMQEAADPCTDLFADGSNVIFTDRAFSGPGGLASFFPLCTPVPLSRTVNATGSYTVSFTYGTSFVEGLTLEVEDRNGPVDFSHTGMFTDIVLPVGATLSAGSGTLYPTSTAAVPEPATLTLTALGLAGLVRRSRRRRASR